MGLLKSEFLNSNIEEVIKSLGNQSITENKDQRFNIKINRNSLPQLTFHDNNKIEPGYYDFNIGKVTFQNCWIEPYSIVKNELIKYKSGSYLAYINY